MQVTINFIWLGGGLLPRYAVNNIGKWAELHPEWHFMMWTDRNRPTLYNEKLFCAAPNYGEASDILRYELLLRDFTGSDMNVYADVDIIPLRNCDALLEGCDYLATVSRSWEGRHGMYAENALLAAKPGHPLLHTAVHEVARNKRDMAAQVIAGTAPGYGTIFDTGPRYLQRVYRWHFPSWPALVEPVARPTDYDLLGTVVRVPPYTAFYPTQHQGLPDSSAPLTVQYVLDNPSQYPDCYGIHDCAGAWIKPAS